MWMPRLFVAATLLLAAGGASADSVRCDGGIVSVGDSRLDLVAKCGWPALQEAEPIATTPYVDAGLLIERWTYDFGPRRFTQVVSLQGGIIVAIDRGGYGYALDPPRDPPPDAAAIPRARCEVGAFHVGDRTFDVLSRCGEPAFRDLRHGPTVVEVWTYDFGQRQFVRHLEFQGGKLVRIRTGSYGYAR